MVKKKNILISIIIAFILLSTLSGFINFTTTNLIVKDTNYYSESPEIAGYETKIIRPDGNYQLEWESSDVNNLNEEIEYPTEGDGIYNEETREGTYTDIFEMSENSSSSGIILKVSQIKLWFYGYAFSFMGTSKLSLNVKVNEKWLGERSILNTGGFDWYYETYEGDWVPEVVEDIQVKTSASINYGDFMEGDVRLDCIYVEIIYKILEDPYQDMSIKTPGTMTYTEDLMDYYPATYGFEDSSGETGLNIDFIDEYSGSRSYAEIKVVTERYGHTDCLRLRDAQLNFHVWGVHEFNDPQESGTMEWYWEQAHFDPGVGSPEKKHYLRFRKADNTVVFQIRSDINYDKYEYNDGGTWKELTTLIPNTWYHHRIMFDCQATQYAWIVTMEDGTPVAQVSNIDFENTNVNTIDEIEIRADAWRGNSHWDAFGYSWDPNYNIGDNREEINPIEGYYPATHGFEDTEDGEVPHDWIDSSTGTNEVKVKLQKEGHKKVLQLKHITGWSYETQAETSFTPQSHGAIDFWFYTSNSLELSFIILKSSSETMIQLCFSNYEWWYFDGNGYLLIPGITMDYTINTWYHIQISFETRYDKFYQGLSQYQWKIRIDNGVKFDYSERVSTLGNSEIEKLMFKIDPFLFSYSLFIDAVGYSWDPYYDMYDNLYEGLLLDIEPDNLDYMEATYFGEVRRVYGDTVFPMPKSGAHTINVYGEKGSVYYYGSRDYNVDFSEGIGVFFYTSDVCEGLEGAQNPPFEYTSYAELYIDEYRDVLAREGYSRLYVYNDMNKDQFSAIFESLAHKRVDEQDEIFISMWAHGTNQGTSSYSHIIPFIYGTQIIYDYEFHSLYNRIETNYKGLLVESCHSGGYVDEFNEFPYLVMSCCQIDEDGLAPTTTREFFFSDFFWYYIDGGLNALEAYNCAANLVPIFTGDKQHPRMAENMPDGFIFFDN